jgi:DNA polymerase-3 subunit epsilon
MTDFAAIDFETANLQRSSSCSIGGATVCRGEASKTFYRLIRPEPDHCYIRLYY